MLLDRFRLDGKAAIVTGAGRGIGRAIAVALGEAGASVACAARTEAEIAAAAEDVVRAGGRALAVPCDVDDDAQLERLVAQTVRAFGRLDVVVNNAGGAPPCLALAVTREEFEAAFRFNVGSAFTLSRLALPHLLKHEGASIVNISSAMSHLVDSGFVAYGTAKAALNHMTRLLACEFAPRVRFNAVAARADGGPHADAPPGDAGGRRRHGPLPRLARLELGDRQGLRGRRRHGGFQLADQVRRAGRPVVHAGVASR